jgi:hypothetical protein
MRFLYGFMALVPLVMSANLRNGTSTNENTDNNDMRGGISVDVDWCGLYIIRAACDDHDERCYWDSDADKCRPVSQFNCFDRKRKRYCVKDRNCIWDSDEGICKWKRRCSHHESKRRCRKDNQCVWIAEEESCEYKDK